MRRQIAEESIIFVSVIKWFVLAGFTGAMVGAATALFVHALNWSTDSVGDVPYFLLLLPPALFLSSLLTKYLAPEAEGHGTEKVIESVHRYGAKIKARVVPVKAVVPVPSMECAAVAKPSKNSPWSFIPPWAKRLAKPQRSRSRSRARASLRTGISTA